MKESTKLGSLNATGGDWRRLEDGAPQICVRNTRPVEILFYLRSCLIVTSCKTVKTKSVLTCHAPHHTRNSTRTTLASWPLKEGCRGPTAGAIERSRREISLPLLQEFIINTFPPGTFCIPSTVRPQGFESSTELWQIKAVETGSLRVKDINPITF